MSKDKHAIEVEELDEDPAAADARREQIRLENQQQELLLNLVEEETVPSWAVAVMLETGIVGLDESDPLPCEHWQRNKHWIDWDHELKAYHERREQEALKAQEGPPQEEGPMSWEEQFKRRPPFPCEVQCPLLANAWEDECDPAPCVKARQIQRDAGQYKDQPEKQRALDDPEDPVNKLELRPCVVMGHMLRDSIFVTLAQRRRAAEARLWPMGKPKA